LALEGGAVSAAVAYAPDGARIVGLSESPDEALAFGSPLGCEGSLLLIAQSKRRLTEAEP
jgi:hypothetical protein